MIKRKHFYFASFAWIAIFYFLFVFTFKENKASEVLHVLGLIGIIMGWITVLIYDRLKPSAAND